MSIQKVAHEKLTIPYCLLSHAVQSQSFRSIQILVATKLLFGSSFARSQIIIISEILGIHSKTVDAHLQKLVDLNLIGFDTLELKYFCRGWNYLRTLLDDETSVGYKIKLDQIKEFKPFAIATTFDQLIASQQSKRWKTIRESLKKGSSKQIEIGTNGFYPVANAAYAKIFNVSEATASRYRSLAHDHGWIEVKPQFTEVQISIDENRDRDLVKEHLDKGLVFRKGRYFIQEISLVRSNMIRKRIPFLSKKKLKAFEKGIDKGEKA